MNDDLTTPVPEAAPGTADPAVPAPVPAPEPVPARRGTARRVIFVATPVVLVLAAVAGAGAYTKAAVDGADRTVETTLWQKPAHGPGKDPAGDIGRGRVSTGTSKLLLPVPAGFRLGPDSGAYGNDTELSGRSATAEMKDSGRGLSGKQRREFEKGVDKLHVQGVGIRTYASNDNDLVVETQLVRMKDKKAVRDSYRFRTGLFDSVGIFRDGPTVSGHKKNATCFLDPKDSKQKIDGMFCMAYEGEAMFTFAASGTKPLDTSAVVELVKDQLNHLTSPGEYV
ncbi:hypothetical protein [Streptomyces sp. NBC_01013]|uniref:hypothetical protein n=1 Tax=Streptomyces sp. NBC_01013 TaxID=2903718 RepID=UPI00386AA1BC|nr:hypothetical protein OG538_16370 [Streptomyces sp. NBC_01013]